MAASGDPVRRELVALLPRLRRFARALTRSTDAADDLVQTALERALRHLDSLGPDAKVDAWMFRIMKNAWIDEIRSRSVRTRVFAPEEEGVNVGAGGEAAMETRLEALAVREAMQELPDEQRMTMALVFVEGLSYREAAEVMEVPIGTVTSRLARGRAALEAKLAEKA
jgi:RNA polymerase sigma-70 factor (ECF subfamily)